MQLPECRACGEDLTIHERVRGICDDPECRRRDVAFQQQRRRETARAEARSLAHMQMNTLPVVILPAFRSELAPLPDERRARFLAHLDEIIEAAAAERKVGATDAEETASATNGASPKDAELPVIGAACGLCEGKCCRLGGDTGLLEPATLHGVLRDRPDSSLAQLRAEYVERLPAITRLGSCVYHTGVGCALPRSLRSRVCNRYLCPEVAELVRVWKANHGRLLAASAEGTSPDRIGIVDGDRIGPVYDRDSARRSPD